MLSRLDEVDEAAEVGRRIKCHSLRFDSNVE